SNGTTSALFSRSCLTRAASNGRPPRDTRRSCSASIRTSAGTTNRSASGGAPLVRSLSASLQRPRNPPKVRRRSALEKPTIAFVAPPARTRSSGLGIIGARCLVGQPQLIEVVVVGQHPYSARLGIHEEDPASLVEVQPLDRVRWQLHDPLAGDVRLGGALG